MRLSPVILAAACAQSIPTPSTPSASEATRPTQRLEGDTPPREYRRNVERGDRRICDGVLREFHDRVAGFPDLECIQDRLEMSETTVKRDCLLIGDDQAFESDLLVQAVRKICGDVRVQCGVRVFQVYGAAEAIGGEMFPESCFSPTRPNFQTLTAAVFNMKSYCGNLSGGMSPELQARVGAAEQYAKRVQDVCRRKMQKRDTGSRSKNNTGL